MKNMFIIDIAIILDKVDSAKAEVMLNQHRAWFKEYFDKGYFLMVGPIDIAGAGTIIAQAKDKAEIEAILAEDVYYADQLATYTVRQWDVKMFNDQIKEYIG